MEAELQGLRDLVAQLQADNAKLREEREEFFSRKQQEGETLLEFSLALMSLMDKVKQVAPEGLVNADVLLRDQFIEHVIDSALRRELKQLVRREPTTTMLAARSEAIRWEREGTPGGVRGRSCSVPSAYGIQYGVQGGPCGASNSPSQQSELVTLKEILKQQQEQLNQLSQSVALLRSSQPPFRSSSSSVIICRRCQRPGHFARDCDARIPPPRQPRSLVSSSRGGRRLSPTVAEN
ncbi:hypothetical protein SRHO_G00079780 [Serrasalmus rhombeus]